VRQPSNEIMERSQESSNNIEEVAGFVAGSYDCVYNAVHGTLYAGSTAVYFVGTFFLFEKKVVIPWERVRQVQRLDQGVAVIDKDETIHSFTALHAPARAWVILVSLHNDALLDSPAGNKKKRRSQLMAPELHHSVSRRIMKRRNSDPASTLNNFMDASQYQSEDEMEDLNKSRTSEVFRQRTEEGKPAPAETPEPPKRPVIDWFNTLTEPKMEDIEEKVGILKIQGMRCMHGGYSGNLYGGNQGLFFFGRRMPWEAEHIFVRFNLIRQFQIQGKDAASPQKQPKEGQQRGLSITTKDGQGYEFSSIDSPDKVWASLIALRNENLTTEGQNRSRTFSFRRMNSDPMMPSKVSFDDSSEDLATTEESDLRSTGSSDSVHNVAEEWDAEVARQKEYENTVVKGQTLPCTMDKFLELFVLDKAPCSVAIFLESRGDSELDVSEWKKTSGHKCSRIIHYKHPVNAPLAPPMAGARKEQSYRRYGDHGLCIETKTIVDDVPMADCFYVADRVRVTPVGADAVTVTMEFNITFVKTTMFKSIIGKTTKSEFTNLFECLFRYYKENLGKSVPTSIPVSDTKQQTLTPSPPQYPIVQSMVVPPMLFVLLAFQIYMVLEMRKISSALQDLQQQCQATENEVFSF